MGDADADADADGGEAIGAGKEKALWCEIWGCAVGAGWIFGRPPSRTLLDGHRNAQHPAQELPWRRLVLPAGSCLLLLLLLL